MGNLVSYVLRTARDSLALCWSRQSRVLLLGLDSAGKTTLLYKLKLGVDVAAAPTVDFNVETFFYKNIAFTAWDLSGQSIRRPLWKFHLERCDAVLFVVDATDRARVDEAANELRVLFQQGALTETKLLVLANKQDRPEPMDLDELHEKLRLPLVTKNASHLAGTVATTGDGVYEALDWLADMITAK